MFEYWENRCAISGISQEDILIASHIKPWSVASDSERLNTFNGFLLAVNYDSVFDKGYITFAKNGLIEVSSQISKETLIKLGIDLSCKINEIDPRHLPFLEWHWKNVFKS
jgi:predicted restriction endonuclease